MLPLPKRPHQKVTKPKGLTTKTLAVDVKELFKALGNGLLHIALQKWDDVASDAIDAVAALGISNAPAALAHILLRRAATRAMFELVGESVKSNLFISKTYAPSIEEGLDYAIAEHEIFINKDFFEKPTSLKFVKGLQTLLEKWLAMTGLEAHIVGAIAKRFPSYFLYALNEEWRKTPKTYKPLLDSLDTPFIRAGEREWAWHSYASLLQRRVDESTYDEAFSLCQVYVPLRAYYEEADTRKIETQGLDRPAKRKTVVDLEKELIDWLNTGNREDAIRVISGGPGSGKSSFAKIFAARIASSPALKVLFVPLHLIDPAKELADEIGRFIREGILTHNPLDLETGDSDLLIIFDGLDELASQGKAAIETARSFVREVERTVARRNDFTLKLRVILSGRELIIQGNESEFRKPHQILNLLPYYIEKGSLGEERYIADPHNILKKDQRQQWWKQYGKLTGKNYEGLPAHLNREDLHEVTSQPLLNYLVALSFSREHLDFSKDVNINQVYEDLVSAVHERAYERNRPYAPIRNMDQASFARVLEEVGLAAWHGDGRTTTVREIQEHCSTSGLNSMLEIFEEGAKAGVTKLLAAFFFRQYGRSTTGDETFVFTHKSFGEYLTARRIVRAMERIANEREAKTKSPDAGWDEQMALVHWAQITGASTTTSYLCSFITNEVKLRGEEFARRVQHYFVQLFSQLLRDGMPMEKLSLGSFRKEVFVSRNAEEALLVCMSICALVTKEPCRIVHPNRFAFGAWLRRVQGQRTGAESVLATKYLTYLNLEQITLYMADLYEANLSYSSLAGSYLTFAVLSQANLTNTNLSKIDAGSSNFNHAQLIGANLREADFGISSLRGCRMLNVALDSCTFANRAELKQVRVEGTTDVSKAQFRSELLAASRAAEKQERAAYTAAQEAKNGN